jgi:hypothetical protein
LSIWLFASIGCEKNINRPGRRFVSDHDWIGAILQIRFPSAFRIEQIAWPNDFFESLRTAEGLTKLDPAAESKLKLSLLADVCTGLWRLRQRMVDENGRPLDEMRRAYRHFESIWDALSQSGFEIHDHTGEPVPEGGVYALKVLVYQPMPELVRDKVIETIKPSIYYRNEAIQMGEVIVGTPEQPNAE